VQPSARIVRLHEELKRRNRPLTVAALQDILGCSRSTVHRLVKRLRDELGAPLMIVEGEGFAYGPGGETWQLPGLWLSPDDLASLRIIDVYLERMAHGVLQAQAKLLRAQVDVLLQQAMADESVSADVLRRRLDVVPPKFAIDRPEIFAAVFEATMRGRRLRFADYARRRGEPPLRDVSPQQLLHYRENWFLVGYCHDNHGQALFSLGRLHHVEVTSVSAEVRVGGGAAQDLTSGSGRRQVARLRFSPAAAASVVGQVWHPEQVGQFATDGSYELRVPFRHLQDILPAILEHGSGVVVQGPGALRNRVIKTLGAALKRYGQPAG
jgi:predicted DNA-binding transcriptional regulator YafY